MDENSNLRSTGDEPLLLITETASPLSSERLEEGLVSIISNFLALFDLVPLKLDGQKTTKQRSLLFLESRTFFLLICFFSQENKIYKRYRLKASRRVRGTPAHFPCKQS